MNKKYLIILSIILIIGGFLRFHKLDFQSMWLDELVTMTVVDMPTVHDIIKITTDADIHPPGFYIILHYWVKAFGTNDIQLKMISVIAGILSILAIYFLAKQVYDSKVGLISSALLSISWFPLYYSQEVRAYSLLLLSSIISTLFYIKIFKKFYFDNEVKKTDVIFYILSIILTGFIHYFGLFLIGLQGTALLIILIVRKKYFKEFLILYSPLVILYLVWLPYMLLQFNGHGGDHFTPPDLNSVFEFFIYIANYNKLAFLIYFIISFALIFKIIYTSNWNFKKIFNQINFETIFLLSWVIIPLVLIFVLSNLVKPVFSFRNLIIIYAPILILFSRLIVFALKNDFQRILLVSGFLVFLIFNLVVTKKYYSEPVKEQYKETSEFLISEKKNYKDSETLAYTYNPEFYNYYFKELGSNIKIDHFVHINFTNNKIKNVISECNSDYLWFVYAHNEPQEYLMNEILNKYSKIKTKSFIGATIILFKKKQ